MFELAGDKPEQAKAHARRVMVETALAKGSLDRVSRRDPEKIYHKMTAQELEALGPQFHWDAYFRDAGAPAFTINVASPEFVKAVNAKSRAPAWTIGRPICLAPAALRSARCCPPPFVEENFNFYGKTLTGATEMRPRWKRCVDFTDSQLGEALGRKFVERTFGAEGKAADPEDGRRAGEGPGQDIQTLAWMTPATKAAGGGQAQSHHQQDRLSRKVARLFQRHHHARRRHRQRRPRRRVRIPARAATRSASRWTAPNGR